MKRLLDLSGLSVPQLLEIKKVLGAGVRAKAETDDDPVADSQLCHKSPPKGYPKEKSQYGDPECYRYPLNTKSRCLAAWRYVHQSQNKSILGGKFKKVESKIKRYAKEHYNLDLQVGESDEIDWEQVFMEYYDAETMGERCELVELEPEGSEASTNTGDDNMEYTKEQFEALETENKALKDETKDLKDKEGTWASEKADLEAKASQVEALTKELKDQSEELDTLRKFKTDTEEAAKKVEKIKNIKAKFEEAGVDFDEAEADSYISLDDDVLAKIIAKMGDLKKGAQASSSIKVPPVSGDDESDARTIASEGLKERKQAKNK